MQSERIDERGRTTRSQKKKEKEEEEGKKRTPLADLTNASFSSSSSSRSLLLKDSKPKPNPNPKSAPLPPSIPRDASERGAEGDPGVASVAPASPPRVCESFLGSGGDGVNHSEPQHSVVYTRRIANRTHSKGKEPCMTSSCPPLEKTRNIKDKLMDDAHTDGRKAFSAPCQKPKKRRRYVVPEAINQPVLPQDFIEKQQAYFAEVDAFELPEEVVSESELE